MTEAAKVAWARGVAALQGNDAPSAASAFRDVIALDPLHSGAHNNLGVALEKLGRIEEALGAFNAAAEIDPDNWRAGGSLTRLIVSLASSVTPDRETIPPPQYVEIEPTKGCNLRCVMCHVSYMTEKAQMLDLDALGSIDFIRGIQVTVGSNFEPTIHPQFNRLIDTLNRNQNRIEFLTNGTRLSRLDVPALYDANFSTVTFSFDGIRKETYEAIRHNSSYEKTIAAIAEFRQSFARHPAVFAVNSTLMRANIEETWETVDVWDRMGIDTLRLIFMVARHPDLLAQSLWPIREKAFAILDNAAERLIAERRKIAIRSPWFAQSTLRDRYPDNIESDTVMSGHPGARLPETPRPQYQLGAAFGMTFPCRSPFTFLRIMPNADVQICYRFTIGNLRDGPLETIWNGEKARAFRSAIRRYQSVCNSCDYFKFCISSRSVDLNRKENYVSQPMLPLVGRL